MEILRLHTLAQAELAGKPSGFLAFRFQQQRTFHT
jgi:hypothetical protein